MEKIVRSQIITLLTDFGLKDAYVGIVKGVILKIFPSAKIVDITHEIEPHNILQASFILAGSWRYFPDGTVHMAVIDPGVGGARRAILVVNKNHFFIGPDNGIFSQVIDDKAKVYHLTKKEFFLPKISQTFHARDIFAPASAWLAKGKEPEEMGEPITDPTLLNLPKPKKEQGKIIGEVIYVDRFGNLITNIPQEMISENAIIRIMGKQIEGLSKSYSEHPRGTLLAIIGSWQMLEVSLAEESASFKLKAGVGQKVEVILPENF